MAKRPIIATLGPSSLHLSREIAEAGATAFRLNGSHMTADDVGRTLRLIRAVSDLPVVVDLQGAKMRLGIFEPLPISQGQPLVFGMMRGSACHDCLPLPHQELFEIIEPGMTLSCDDGRIHMRVERVEPRRLWVTCLSNAVLLPRKGVNVVESPVYPQRMAEADLDLVQVATEFSNVGFACSFMRDGQEADWVRKVAKGCQIAGKIELAEAIVAIGAIAAKVDSVWICRGDLGAQIGEMQMARWMSEFDPRSLPVPTLIAGQVLEHLTYHEFATRSEVCHVVDLLRRGYRGLVLSDETAIGTQPVGATRTAYRLVESFDRAWDGEG